MRQMKKKGTRKIRKNRQTKRRNNRSYKRMRGGMYPYTEKGLFKKEPIPEEVKTTISKSGTIPEFSTATINLLKQRYEKIIPINEANTHFYQKYEGQIKKAITKFTVGTGEDPLKALPVSNSEILPIIKILIENLFLPTKDEFADLYRVFHREMNTTHKKPFKFNGLALAFSLIEMYDQQTSPSGNGAKVAVVKAATAKTEEADLTNIQQKYIFVFDPRQPTSWENLTTGIPPNPFCHHRQRIRMCSLVSGGRRPFGADAMDREIARYDKIHIVDHATLALDVNRKIDTGEKLIRDQDRSGLKVYTKTTISDNRSHRGEYKFYRIEKRSQNIDFATLRYSECRNKIFIPVDINTVYEYDEDGIINWVYIVFTHLPVTTTDDTPPQCVVHHKTPSKAVNDEVIGSMENILKLGLNPRITNIHQIGELEPLIDLSIEISRGSPPPGVPTDGPDRFTLFMTGSGIWNIYGATPTQQAAFNRVNQYLKENTIQTYDMLQIKRFRVSNRLTGPGEIMVIIEVKEMNADGTLNRAICMGDTLSQFEVLATLDSAGTRKRMKEANYSQVTSSGLGG
jgi:hypothetical protein